ncbi:MAG: CorA family divalent cation transporter [Lyngbya sp.]|nr:CorA family divalent cation transporter [Lyngbya sp.]
MKLPPTWAIPESIRDRLGQKSAGKQRAMVSSGHLLLVLHQAPQPGSREREAVFFWRQPDGRWEASLGGVGFQRLIQQIKAYSLAEENLTDQYFQAQSSEDYFHILENLAPLQRATKNLHATLQSAREAIPNDRDLIDLRDAAYETERTLDLLYQNTKNALDFAMAKKSEEQAKLSLESVRSAHRLNLLAAIFFPLTAISCVFGMNLPTGLETQSPALFWIVFFGGIFLGFMVRNWVLTGRLSTTKEEKKIS